jgi:ferric-dicitrate binding protein FerR (iron transport regulator)
MENHINHIIARVLSGESSLEDILQLGDWLNLEENKKEFERIKSYWEAEVTSRQASNPEHLLKKIRQKIDSQQKERKQKQFRLLWIPAAAVALVLLVSTFFLLYDFPAKDDSSKAREHYTYLTNDNKSCFTLSDGTKITLNKNSRLTFTDTYGANKRYVKLEGEAFFEVVNDPASPFEVAFNRETEDVAIRVLGTVFNVRIDARPERIIATLVEGSILFESQKQKITLTPNQQLVFTYADKKIDIREVDVEEEIAWKDGLLKYRTVPFTQLIDEVAGVYGLDIRITNKKLTDPSIRVSGTFDEKQSIEQILKVVSQSLPIRWTKKGEVYYIE